MFPFPLYSGVALTPFLNTQMIQMGNVKGGHVVLVRCELSMCGGTQAWGSTYLPPLERRGRKAERSDFVERRLLL